MARSIELAYLPESRLSGTLEVMRRLLEPFSRSLPHLTVRHAARPPSKVWGGASHSWSNAQITFEGPTTFDSSADLGGIRSVVVACTSGDIEDYVYKPDFPQSLLHFTLYDGESSEVAALALRQLSSASWNLQYRGPLVIYSSSKDASANSSLALRDGIWLTDAGFEVLREARVELDIDRSHSLIDLLPDDRLQYLSYLTDYLHSSTGLDRIGQDEAGRAGSLDHPGVGQQVFWTEDEIDAYSVDGVARRAAIQQRKTNSSFATPPELGYDVAIEAVRYLKNMRNIRFGDPAVGNGVLFSAARRALREGSLKSALGVEKDTTTAARTIKRWSRFGLKVTVGDFLVERPEFASWDLVLANPPYRRSQIVGRDVAGLRSAIATSMGIHVSARSDLYVYFILLAHQWLAPGAVAAWIIPAEFSVTSYGRALREYLLSTVHLERVHTYDTSSPLFDNALTSTSVVVFSNTKTTDERPIRFTQGGTLKSPDEELQVSTSILRASKKWNFAGLRLDQTRSAPSRTLGELFDIRRGIATGANSWFVIDDVQRETLKVESRWVRPLMPAARSLADGRVRSDENGLPLPGSGRWLIDTSDSLDEIASSSAVFALYLRDVAAIAGRRPLAGRRPVIQKQENRREAPFYFVYMAKADTRTDRFVRNDSLAIALNNFHYLYPKENVARRLKEDAGYIEGLHDAMRSIPNSILAAHGRLYGNGLLKLEPSDLAGLEIGEGFSEFF